MRLLTIYILTRRLNASTCQESENYTVKENSNLDWKASIEDLLLAKIMKDQLTLQIKIILTKFITQTMANCKN